jgi:NDP-sugar pyrophosphorylase family protein
VQTVILAGGLGTRLRPLTEQTPKPMVEVGGRPFLEYIVEHIAAQGFRDLLLLIGHLGEHVSDHFGDGGRFGVSIEYSREPRPLGTGGAIRFAREKLSSEFLLLYGDSFLPIDYVEVAAAFRQSRRPAMVVTYDNQAGYTDVFNNISVDAAGCVTRYEKGVIDPELKYVDAGALCLHRSVFAEVPVGSVVSLEQELFPQWIAARQLAAFSTKQRFYDIGTPARLQEFITVQSCSSREHHSG